MDPLAAAEPDCPGAADWGWAAGGAAAWVSALMFIPPTPFDGVDYFRFFGPYAEFLRTSLQHGEIPWWNPYASLGRPFVADLQSASFYPPTYLGLLFGLRGGLIVAAALHALLALLGCRLLLRRLGVARPAAWGGALALLFTAPWLDRMQAGSINLVFGFCYLPVILLLALRLATAPTRRRWIALAGLWALQVLSSHPQAFWLTALAAAVFVTGLLAQPPWGAAARAWGGAMVRLATSCAAGLALSGVALVPLFELVGQSNRTSASPDFSAKFAMGVDSWLSLLAAPSAGFAVNWEYDVHVGAVVAVGALLALTRLREPALRGAAGLIATGAVIAAGSSTPLFGVLYHVLPGLASFRIPARAGLLIVVGLVIAAASAAGGGARTRPSLRAILLAVTALSSAVVLYFIYRLPVGPAVPRWLGTQLGWLAAAGVGWWWQGPAAGDGARRWLLAALLAGEIGVALWGLKQLPGSSSQFPIEAVVAQAIHARGLDRQPAPVRVSLDPTLIRENSGMIRGYATLTGFESLSLERGWTYLHRAAGADPGHPYSTIADGRVYDHAGLLHSVNLTVTLPAQANFLAIDPAPDPRAYLTTRFTRVPDAMSAMAHMVAGHPFHDDALVEASDAVGLKIDANRPRGTAAIVGFTLNSVDLAVESPGPALLVVAEAWYPGWQAAIAGQPVPCLPVNGWMRGVPVPAGASLVRLSFHQHGFAAGAALSLGTGLLLAWLWCRPEGGPGHLRRF